MSSKRSVSSRRTSDQISAATVSSSRRGSGAANITTLPSATTGLRPAAPDRAPPAAASPAGSGGGAGGRLDEARVEVALGQLVVEPHAVASRSPPQRQQRVLARPSARPPPPRRVAQRQPELPSPRAAGRVRPAPAADPPSTRGTGSARTRTATTRAPPPRRSIDTGARRTRCRTRARTRAGATTSAGVRAKKSGRVSAASGANTPARPNSASHSSRCQRCTGSLTPATSAPRRQTSSISGREYAYSSNSCASSRPAAPAGGRSRCAPSLRVFAQVPAHRRQIARRQAPGRGTAPAARPRSRRGRRCAPPASLRGDVTQEAAQEARLDVGGDAQPPGQRLLDDALDERIRHHQATASNSVGCVAATFSASASSSASRRFEYASRITAYGACLNQ